MNATAPLIDTHAHLDDDQFRADFPQILDRARAAGLVRMIAIATTAPSARSCVALARAHPSIISASAGIHPNSAAEAAPGDWDTVVALAQDPQVVAIGETGLDRYRDNTPFPIQEDYFSRHLDLGRATGKTVVIHCREADADVLRMLWEKFDKHGPFRAVLHSFCGDAAMADACLKMGFYLSFSGMITYKTAANIRNVAATVPLDRVLVETDAPYLAPVPMRGKRNEPAHVKHTAACLAGVLGVTLEQLAQRTTANARTLFGIQ